MRDDNPPPLSRPLLAVVALVLLVGALPYLPAQIDDAWITFAYAWNLAEHGELAWSSGERVEGFSSWTHLGLMTLGALAGLDLSVLAKLLSVVCTVLALAAVGSRRSGPERGLLLLALAAWQPLQFWSTQQLETMLAAALAAWAWPGVLAGGAAWAASCVGLAVLAVTRPEGAAWLGIALAARVWERRTPGRADLVAGAAVLGLAAFHAGRIAWFGEVWPTPFLVKVQSVASMHEGWRVTGLQLASAGVVLALLPSCRVGIPTLAWAPLALQALLLLRADGDWMGNARFLVPGVFAAVTAALRHGTPVAPGYRRPLLLALLPVTFLWESEPMAEERARLRDLKTLVPAIGRAWSYPLQDDVRFIVERVPEGAAVQLSDVGTPGHVPGVRVLDSVGLVDRAVAELFARRDDEALEVVLARFEPAARLACVRYAPSPDGEDAEDLGPLATFSVVDASSAAGQRWRCREDTRVPLSVQRARWELMSARFPAQPWLRNQVARARVAAGDEAGAFAGAAGADIGRIVLPDTRGGYQAGRGARVVTEGQLVSAALTAARWDTLTLVLDADDPGEDGALAEVRWVGVCEAHGLTASVATRTAIPLPPCDEPGPRSLGVRFLNDHFADGVDRNLWVGLEAR